MATLESESTKTILNPEAENLVFSPYTLRLMIGVIAFALPPVVVIITATITSSISASYHTNARDVFVGLLFVIGAFLLAYNGHKPDLDPNDMSKFWQATSKFWNGAIDFRVAERKIEERVVSLIGGLAAILTALNPTACDTCQPDLKSHIHIAGAAILFSTIAYFCLIAFRGQVKNATSQEVRKLRRRRIYTFCGWGIVVVMLGLVVAQFTISIATSNAVHITFWAELIALWLFGIAWMTASKFFSLLADKDEQPKIARLGVKEAEQRLFGKPANLPS